MGRVRPLAGPDRRLRDDPAGDPHRARSLAGHCGSFVIRPKSVTRPSATVALVCSPDAARRDSGLCCRCHLMLTASAAALARKTTP
jgi:hypothetical protein